MSSLSGINKTTINIVTASYSFTQFSTLAKIHTTTAREPSIYTLIGVFNRTLSPYTTVLNLDKGLSILNLSIKIASHKKNIILRP